MNLYQKVDQYLLDNKAKWIQQGKELERIPEYGFCEYKTSAYVQKKFDELGIDHVKNCAVTARLAKVPGKNHKANIGFIAEMDGVYSPNHYSADPDTGLSHSCGHHIQTAALLAVAEALIKTGVLKELDGDITFIAVPAEEATPMQTIDHLKAEGKISTVCGKHELIHLAALDGIDLMLGTHALVNYPGIPDKIMVNSTCHGLKSSEFTFHGKSAHATVCPEKGINALNAAVNAICAINALRERFDPEEEVRVAYNITQGGNNLGTVVDTAVLEVGVATKSIKGLHEAYDQVCNAIKGAAMAAGCTLDGRKRKDYLPYVVDQNLMNTIKENASGIINDAIRTRPHNYFSNDLGDVSAIMPTAQIVFGGFLGDLHSADFHITDEDNAYVLPARVVAKTLIDLLSNGAEKAIYIKENFKSADA